MPSYTLYYFNGRGRAEVIRMIFAVADITYNDKRIDFDDWNTFKARMPCSCLPVLELENKIQIPQSMAISRYLAREFGMFNFLHQLFMLSLYGKNNLDMARIDYICDSLYDLFNDFMRMYYNKEGRIMPTFGADMRSRAMGESPEMRQIYTETCRKVLPFLEKTLEKYNDGNKFFMGEEMTLADMMFFASLENPLQENPSLLSSYPKLTALRNRVEGHPKIGSYTKRRNLTDF